MVEENDNNHQDQLMLRWRRIHTRASEMLKIQVV